MNKQTTNKPVIENLKEKNALHIFTIGIRDREHFYKIVNWMNANVGKGEANWTMAGRVLKALKQGRSVTTTVYVFVENFDKASVLYLTLV